MILVIIEIVYLPCICPYNYLLWWTSVLILFDNILKSFSFFATFLSFFVGFHNFYTDSNISGSLQFFHCH